MKTPHTPGRCVAGIGSNPIADFLNSGRLALAVLALVGGMPLLVSLSLLRETPSFWTNAGGYPIWLRELVLIAYYPLFLMSLGGTALYSYLLVSSPPRSNGRRCAEFSVWILMFAAIAASVVVDLG